MSCLRRKLFIWHLVQWRDQSQNLQDHLARDPQLTWTELEVLLVGGYVNKETAVEAMKSLMKLAQMKGKSPGDLEVKAQKLAALAFPEEIRENIAIQAKLADLYVEALQNEHLWHDAMK